MVKGGIMEMHNPADMPEVTKIKEIREPWINATIYTPDEYLGAILKLCQDRRGIQTELSYVGGRALVKYELPLNEVVFDFYDRLKSISRGYASFDYEIIGHRAENLVKLQILGIGCSSCFVITQHDLSTIEVHVIKKICISHRIRDCDL